MGLPPAAGGGNAKPAGGGEAATVGVGVVAGGGEGIAPGAGGGGDGRAPGGGAGLVQLGVRKWQSSSGGQQLSQEPGVAYRGVQLQAHSKP